jgi:hypothetical protein
VPSCHPLSLPDAGLPLAVAEQDHRLRSAIFFELGYLLLALGPHTHDAARKHRARLSLFQFQEKHPHCFRSPTPCT